MNFLDGIFSRPFFVVIDPVNSATHPMIYNEHMT